MNNWTVFCECGYESSARDSVEATKKATRHSYSCFKKTQIEEE